MEWKAWAKFCCLKLKRFLYLISPSKINVNFYKDLEDVLSAKKVNYFQIRLNKYSDSKIIRIPKKVRALTKKYKVKLIINDSPVLAKKINADGCHLGQSDVSIKDSRNLLKKRKNNWNYMSWFEETNFKCYKRKTQLYCTRLFF